MDQREWDYGTRLPRERRSPDAWTRGNGPETDDSSGGSGRSDDRAAPLTTSRWRTDLDPPTWGSVTDTGSMEPIADAVAWSVRADAWSQRSSGSLDRVTSWEEPASRWSEVATTGRPAFPPDGVGWRSGTSEWRSTTEPSRWRQTTEWRSSTGTSGWRSTTEAWQAGDNADGVRPPVDPPTRQPAISGTAWPTPQSEEQSRPAPVEPTSGWQSSTDSVPSWQQAEPTGWQAAGAEPAPPWLAPIVEPIPPWQAPGAASTWPESDGTSPWRSSESAAGRRDAVDGVPSWQQLPESAPSWGSTEPTPSRQAAEAPASWRLPPEKAPEPSPPPTSPPAPSPLDGPLPADAALSWPVAADSGAGEQTRDLPSWRQPADQRPSWQTSSEPPRSGPAAPTSSWQTSDPTPSWQAASDTTPSWQTSDPTPSWQVASDTTPSWQTSDPTPSWQASAPTPSWQTSDPTPSWQTASDPAPSWQTPSDSRSPRRDSPAWPDRQSPATATPADRGAGRAGSPEPAAHTSSWSMSATVDDGRHLVREDDRAQWRREFAGRRSADDDDTRRIGRRRAPESDAGQRSAGTGWTVTSESDNWPGHADTSTIPAYRDGSGRDTTRRRLPGREAAGRDATGREATRRRRRAVETDNDEIEPDSGSWSREEPRTERRRTGRRSKAEPAPWRDAGMQTGPVQRPELRPASDPWAEDVAETGAGPLPWDDPDEAPVPDRRPAAGSGSRRYFADDFDAEDLEAPRFTDPPGPADAVRPRSGSAMRQPIADDRAAPPEPVVDDVSAAPDEPVPWRDRRGPAAGDSWRASRQNEAHTESWRRELQQDLRREATGGIDRPAPGRRPPDDRGDAITEIGGLAVPDDWRLEQREATARGIASYRGSGTDDWRQQLAEQNAAVGDEPAAPIASEFPRFKPSTSMTAGAGAAPVLDGGRREDLLVGARTAGSWQDPPDTQWPPRRAVEVGNTSGSVALAPPYERRAVGTMPESSRRQTLLESDEDLEEEPGGQLAAVGFTAAWYGVPVVLFVLYMLVLDGAQQTQALNTLAGAAPQFGVSLALSMVVAVGLRRASGSWKAASVGLAAAVVGGGLATVLNSAITGQSLS